jgi:hypothetical protein
MTWYTSESQGPDPGLALKTYRKLSALVRWLALVGAAGLALAALIGFTTSALLTAIQS